jgi:sulfopyruvate decarboxylase subunit alpha
LTDQQDEARRAESERARVAAERIVEALADAGVRLVASLPDNWIAPLIQSLDEDVRFRHVAVNREESAVGLCCGEYFGGRMGVALMGASGLMTCIYAITKINYTYQIPMLFLVTIRGTPGDTARYHVSNGLYLRPLLQSINLPFVTVACMDELRTIAPSCRHAHLTGRPYVVGLSKDLLSGKC